MTRAKFCFEKDYVFIDPILAMTHARFFLARDCVEPSLLVLSDVLSINEIPVLSHFSLYLNLKVTIGGDATLRVDDMQFLRN